MQKEEEPMHRDVKTQANQKEEKTSLLEFLRAEPEARQQWGWRLSLDLNVKVGAKEKKTNKTNTVLLKPLEATTEELLSSMSSTCI